MVTKLKGSMHSTKTGEGVAREEIDRANARLRHFRGVAAIVMGDALKIWGEIWDACQDHRSCDEILEGIPEPPGLFSGSGRAESLEKLHLLGTYIDYAKRLCEGSIDQLFQHESEVEVCLDSSQSFPEPNQPNITRSCRPKKKRGTSGM